MKKFIFTLLFLFSTQCTPAMNQCAPTHKIIDCAQTLYKLIHVGIFIDVHPIFELVHQNKTPDYVTLIKLTGLVNKRDLSNKTPLENALGKNQTQYKKIVELLIAAGAKL